MGPSANLTIELEKWRKIVEAGKYIGRNAGQLD